MDLSDSELKRYLKLKGGDVRLHRKLTPKNTKENSTHKTQQRQHSFTDLLIYRAAKQRCEYPPLATDTEVNSGFSIY